MRKNVAKRLKAIIWKLGVMTLCACGATPTISDDVQDAATQRYMTDNAPKIMQCFTTVHFNQQNAFLAYGEQCYVECLSLPSTVTTVVIEGKKVVVNRRGQFCKPLDRVIKARKAPPVGPNFYGQGGQLTPGEGVYTPQEK